MEIAIYLEGGGDSSETKAALRQGMSAFLRPLVEQARLHGIRWSITPCGGRQAAFDAFQNALIVDADVFNVLLVDSEAEVVNSPSLHLRGRDGWDLTGIPESRIHLMSQCMETWVVADVEALASFYGQNFNRNPLPRRINLEQEPKLQIYAALENATRHTQKGAYGKIKHASQILKVISPANVQARCRHCVRFFDSILDVINAPAVEE